MTEETFLELDVRPMVAAQQPPLGAVLDAVSRLQPGQALRLIAPFEPVPLFRMLGQQGFRHEARMEDDGSWVVLFRRQGC